MENLSSTRQKVVEANTSVTQSVSEREENHVNLQKRWQELNAFVIRFCTDKTDEYLWRRLVNDAVETAFEQMKRR
jgi:cephalosporin-C deacetylase-like acetyl esterase